jgi:hypothetical protein
VTRGQFEILLSKLDEIDVRIRALEMDAAGYKAVRKARQAGDLEAKWKAGIVASIVGGIVTLAAKVYDALTNGGK